MLPYAVYSFLAVWQLLVLVVCLAGVPGAERHLLGPAAFELASLLSPLRQPAPVAAPPPVRRPWWHQRLLLRPT